MKNLQLNTIKELLKEKNYNNYTVSEQKFLNEICYMSLTDIYDIKKMLTNIEIETLLNYCDTSGFAKNYGYKWGVLHWLEQNNITISKNTKDYLLHHCDISGKDNNGNNLLFKAVTPQSYFDQEQTQYLLHTLNLDSVNLFGENILDYYLYNNYSTLNSEQLTYLIEHTDNSISALKNYIASKCYLSKNQIDLLLAKNNSWDTYKTNDNLLIDNILIYTLKQKEEELFNNVQWEYIISNTLHNINEALIVMDFFSRVSNLSLETSHKLSEINHMYELMKKDNLITLPAFEQYSNNLPLSLAKNISLNFSEHLLSHILTKVYSVIDEYYIFSHQSPELPILQKIKNMLFHQHDSNIKDSNKLH